ncbi:GntR family transcriptional regulator [Muricoccus radiodurans]|uniref:GntR family transcriptional regulator n=1 Tax=Muricoccus radiodurans TaxID=2231721 RepID=UPI003CFA954B
MDGPAPLAASASLVGRARAELERLILDGALPPGERLNEVALAARLGLSRGPLREALRGLERDGLVAAGAAGQGMHVRRIEPEELAEIYDMRAVLQGFNCALLAARITPGALAALRARVAEMDAAITAGDAGLYYRQNLDFHDAMLDAAEHRRSAALYRGLVKEAHLTRKLVLRAPPNMRESNAEHAAMLDAIETGDAERARAVGEAHVNGGRRRWLGSLDLTGRGVVPARGG